MTKERVTVTSAQRREYAKLMVHEGYSNREIEKISGAGKSAVSRWKCQYKKELSGITPKDAAALTPEHRRIQELEKALRQAKKDNDTLKKAAAFFIRDNRSLS